MPRRGGGLGGQMVGTALPRAGTCSAFKMDCCEIAPAFLPTQAIFGILVIGAQLTLLQRPALLNES